jgi:UDP-N-acetylmuramate--alanine ligase
MRAYGHKGALHVPKRADVAQTLQPRLLPGDLLVTLGAGDVWMVGEEILAARKALSAGKTGHG